MNDGFRKEPVVPLSYIMTKKEYHKEYNKKYYQANKEKIRAQQGAYEQNPAVRERRTKDGVYAVQRKEYDKNWFQDNKGKVYTVRNYKRVTDPVTRLMENIRKGPRQVLKGKFTTSKGLGCDSKFLRGYISSLWTEGMNWDNYGNGRDKWNIDHIIPVGKLRTNPELLDQIIHYTNLQPMWQPENESKGNR